MKNKMAVFICFLIAANFAVSGTASGENARMAGIQITKDVPPSAAAEIAAAGFDTVVIYYAPFRTPDDAEIMSHLRSWGGAAAALGLNIYVRIETGPPIDAVSNTATVKYRAAASDDGYPQEHKPAPASAEFWQTAIFPKIDRLAELSAQFPIRGVVVNLRVHVRSSFDAETFAEFISEKKPGEDVSKVEARQRMSYLAGLGLSDEYEKFQQDRIRGFVSDYLRGLKNRAPGFNVLIGDYSEDPLHLGFASALEDVYAEPAFVFFELLAADEKEIDLTDKKLLLELSVRRFDPKEIEAAVGVLNPWNVYFVVIDAESLWADLDGINVNEWPLGAAGDYLAAVASAKHAGETEIGNYRATLDRLAGRVEGEHSGIPRLALIYSGYMGYMYRDVFDLLLAGAGIKIDKYENTKLDKLVPKLGDYDAIVTAPGYNAVKPGKFMPYAKDLLRFVKNGGALFVLDATIPPQTAWLGEADPELKLVAEEKSGLSQKWLNSEFRMLGCPSRITKFPIGKFHFSEAAPGWRPLAKDNEDRPYVVQRLYGEGMIIAIANIEADPEFLINGWEYMLKVKDRFDVKIDPHTKPLLIGKNEATFVVRTIGPERKLKVEARVFNRNRDEQRHEQRITVGAEGGARFAVPFEAKEAGIYRITLTFIDEERGRVDRRESFSFLAPEPYEAQFEKSYYTTETEASLGVICRKSEDCGDYEVEFTLKSNGGLIQENLESLFDMAGYFLLPISNLPPGDYEVSIEVTEDDGAKYSYTVPLRKLPPGPAIETKLLNFEGGLLEVNGKPYFPLGIYSIPPENMDELRQSGVNGMIYYGNSVQAESDINAAIEGKGILFSAYPFYPHSRIHDADRATLEQELRDKAKNGNMFMWYLADEPEGFGQSPELIGEVYDLVKEIDPYRPQAIVMMTPSEFSRYADATDIFMFDRYPTPFGPLDSVGLYAQRSVQAVYGRKPVFAIPQAFSWEVWNGSYREGKEHRPNYTEMRSSAIQCIAADVKGIIYWAFTASRYDMRKFPSHVEDFKRLMKELSGLMDVLMEPNDDIDITVEPDFKGIEWGAKIITKYMVGDHYVPMLYIFAYNGEPASLDNVKFTLPERIKDKTVEVYGENRAIPMQGNSFTDSFDYYASHIYVVPD